MNSESEDKVEELTLIIVRARGGDVEAYDLLVRRFQAMAIAYAYSMLGDMDAAEDAAQEAFLEAFDCLPGLHEPLAFSQWLRRIIWKQCDRVWRRKQPERVSLDAAQNEASGEETYRMAEQKEVAAQVRLAIAALPESERVVTLLFYMGQHSQKDIAEFLEWPLSTVKKRLYTARQKLKRKLSSIMKEDLKLHLPAADTQFAERIQFFTSQFSRMIDDGKSIVYSLSILAQKQENTDIEAVVKQMQMDIQQGSTLSESMSKFPLLFEQTYVDRIRSGEMNGNLKMVLRQLGAV